MIDPRVSSYALVRQHVGCELGYPWHRLCSYASATIRLIERYSHSLGPCVEPGTESTPSALAPPAIPPVIDSHDQRSSTSTHCTTMESVPGSPALLVRNGTITDTLCFRLPSCEGFICHTSHFSVSIFPQPSPSCLDAKSAVVPPNPSRPKLRNQQRPRPPSL